MKVPLFFLFKDDISYKKLATQSHTTIGTDTKASSAVDRNTATCIRTLPIGTNNPDKTVWWKVDLGGVYNIQSITMVFKNYDNHGVFYYIKSMCFFNIILDLFDKIIHVFCPFFLCLFLIKFKC